MMVVRMTWSKVKVTKVWKLRKWPISKYRICALMSNWPAVPYLFEYLQFYTLLSEHNCVMMTCALIEAVVWLQIANLLTTFKSLFLSVTSEAQHLINFVDEYVVCEDVNVCYVNAWYVKMLYSFYFCNLSAAISTLAAWQSHWNVTGWYRYWSSWSLTM